MNSYILNALNVIDSRINKLLKSVDSKNQVRILYGPSFSIYSPSFVHDRLLSAALRLRNAQIIPIFCDAIQRLECNVYGGVWGGGDKFKANCRNCFIQSELLWKNSSIKPIRLSEYLWRDDRKNIENLTRNLKKDEWVKFNFDNLPLGLWAKDILVNNYVVGDFRLIKNHRHLGLAHLKNLMLLKLVYERILSAVKPDRVITNDSYYGMWKILQELSKRKKIPFYSHWIGSRKNGWCYAKNDAAMNLDLSKPWKKFSGIPLTSAHTVKIRKWLQERHKGKEMIFDTASQAKFKTDKFNMSGLDKDKPTALLAANVIWDLAALNKQIVFPDMMSWIIETIRWFGLHREYQLIIKPHPAELHPAIPNTKERVTKVLEEQKIKIPPNVFVLSPKVNFTVYQLFPLIDVGLVHTTTVGIEMAAYGIPVITSANSLYRNFGFTYDPASVESYFRILNSLIKNKHKKIPGSWIDLSYKFILLYFFRYFIKLNLMEIEGWEVSKLLVSSPIDLIKGKNIYLDFVVDSILNGMPIVSENKWPPES